MLYKQPIFFLCRMSVHKTTEKKSIDYTKKNIVFTISDFLKGNSSMYLNEQKIKMNLILYSVFVYITGTPNNSVYVSIIIYLNSVPCL